MNESFNVAPGGAVESYQPQNNINQIYSVWIDNFSGGWLGIVGRNLWVPPYTRGWKATIFPGMSSITIRSYNFANGAAITGATGNASIVTIWDVPNGDSEGIEFFDQQTIPITIPSSATVFNGIITAPLVPAPSVGRIRVYQINIVYAGYPFTSESIEARIWDTISFATLAFLEISPASPSDSVILTKPGGDLPIGNSLSVTLVSDVPTDSVTTATILTRYAVI